MNIYGRCQQRCVSILNALSGCSIYFVHSLLTFRVVVSILIHEPLYQYNWCAALYPFAYCTVLAGWMKHLKQRADKCFVSYTFTLKAVLSLFPWPLYPQNTALNVCAVTTVRRNQYTFFTQFPFYSVGIRKEFNCMAHFDLISYFLHTRPTKVLMKLASKMWTD